MGSAVTEMPLETRSDLQRVVLRLLDSVKPYFSPGRARVRLGSSGALYPDVDAELEGFSRPLWGLAPLVAGGGSFDGWDRYRTGLANGCNPDHEEYWGTVRDFSQKHVEMAAIGFALVLSPYRLWTPLAPEEQNRVAEWLYQTNEAAIWDNNWLFLRALTNLGLRGVGADHDWERVQADLDRLETYYRDDGWYSDGGDDSIGPRDYYVAWEMHFDGLLYARLVGGDDPERAARFRDRARRFADEYVHWFDRDGRALPYGRSLTYRFAQAAFWGALAFADVEPRSLSWGEVKGLWWRNVRWWFQQPIFTDSGVLSIGYRYPNIRMAEVYNSPSGPYWALKSVIPLALPPDHPFWKAEERPMPDLPPLSVQGGPNKIICRHEPTDHVFSLAAGQSAAEGSPSFDHEKYNKFAYSADFGFGVATGRPGLAGAGHDSTLALSEDARHYRMRETVSNQCVSDAAAYSRWQPFEDVTVQTWLVPALPWHVRVHRLDNDRRLHSAEGGFAIDRTGDHAPDQYRHRTGDASALARYPAGTSGLRDLFGDRDGSVVVQDPNANLHYQRTVAPTLTGVHDPGETWMAAGVIASPAAEAEIPWENPPTVTIDDSGFTVADVHGNVVYGWKG